MPPRFQAVTILIRLFLLFTAILHFDGTSVFACIERSDRESCQWGASGKKDGSMDMNAKEGSLKYFASLKNIYGPLYSQTGIENRKQCGWEPPRNSFNSKSLPTFVLSVGLEGAGHHLYSELFGKPVFDCLWVRTSLQHNSDSYAIT